MPESVKLGERSAFVAGAIEDRGVLIPLALVCMALVTLLESHGIDALRRGDPIGNTVLYAMNTLILIIPPGARALWRDRPERPIGYLRRLAAKQGLLTRLVRGCPMLLGMIVFMPAFSMMKSAIPLFNAYTWDATFIAADQAIHGTDPWRILQPLVGHPWVTAALAGAYHLWIFLIYMGGPFFAFFVTDRTLRARYFLSYFAIWTIIGVFLATMLASVGPCFVGPILGNQHFAEQMNYLHRAGTIAPIMVLEVQDQLLAWHRSGSHGLGRGISAMPSMHVALALMFALAINQHSRRLGRLFGGFFVIILIASVHLGYHYAVDGYVSIIVTLAIWWVSAPLARRIAPGDRTPEVPAVG